MRIVYKKAFLKRLELFSDSERQIIFQADQQIKAHLEGRRVPFGLRIKKIGPHTFEARATDKIRIVWVNKEETAFFALIGTHDEVRRFIGHG